MIPAKHLQPQQTGSEQETSFLEAAEIPPDDYAIVGAEDSINNEPESSRNQLAVMCPNTIVNNYSSQIFEYCSTSTESVESSGRENQLVQHITNGVCEQHGLNANGRKFIFSSNRNLKTDFIDTRIYKGPVTFHQNFYCCSSTFFEGSKLCSNKRCIANFAATLIGILIFTFLFIWIPTSNLNKHKLVPVTTVISTMAGTGIAMDTKNLAPTEARNDLSSTESTTMLSGDYSTSVKGQTKEENKTNVTKNPLKIITRDEWDAETPRKPFENLKISTALNVIISETSTESCAETEKCIKIIRGIQRSQSKPVYSDIAYNFLIGGEGQIYEGRGWDVKGNVAVDFDRCSINIAFIGNFSSITPPDKQVRAALELIQAGVENNKINMSYKLYGKKQVTYMSENPGDKLYNIITKWQQWQRGTIGVDLHIPLDEEYKETMAYLNIFEGTRMKYIPKRGRN